MKVLFRFFGKGILISLPFLIVFWIISFLFGVVKHIWIFILDKFVLLFDATTNNSTKAYYSGVSASLFIIIFIIGILIYIGYKFEKQEKSIFIKIGEFVVSKIPFLGTVYHTIKDMISMLSGSDKDKYLGVAFIKFGNGEIMGFITRQEEEYYWVFVPLTPPTTGFILKVHNSELNKSDISVNDGLKKVLSFGMQ